VRNLDFSKVGNMLHAMIARILAGGVLICINVDEEAAADILNKLVSTDYAVSTLNDPELNTMWLEFIRQVRTSVNVHPLLSGYATRLLNDKGDISPEEAQNTLSYYSSVGNAPADMAYTGNHGMKHITYFGEIQIAHITITDNADQIGNGFHHFDNIGGGSREAIELHSHGFH